MNAPIRSDQIAAAATSPALPGFVHLRVRSACQKKNLRKSVTCFY